MELVHKYHKTVGLNNYERKYFQKHFGNNLSRLIMFRKAISKEQTWGYYANDNKIGTFRTFLIKGGKQKTIWLTRKKVDAYIREIKESKKEENK